MLIPCRRCCISSSRFLLRLTQSVFRKIMAAIRTRMKVMISDILKPPPRLSLLILSSPKFEFFVSLLSVSMESATSELLLLPIARIDGGRMKSQEMVPVDPVVLLFQKKMVDNGES